MKVILTAGGPANELPDFSLWPDALYIGVDFGTIVLLENGIMPAAAVGDFDSVTSEQYRKIEALFPDMQRVPAEKDETDTELALEKAMSFHPDTVIVTGVTGGRLDHYMSSLHAVYAYQRKFPDIRFLLVNRQNRIRFLNAGTHSIKRDERFRFISFYPFAEEVRGFSLKGFKYEVADETIHFGSTRFISNELDHAGTVSLIEGNCIMIESDDE